ncbi:hypothetical protein J4H46_22975 [Vibrio alginolyticus]|nr:hypothetical protein [Vibrio alginolyticus]ELA6773663.1 hypothetical protein [Vibrio alginolyticus]MBN3002005.1 hypothetical protein [Vibrio alginolyticus]MBT0101401.1 hypothetical protein [Vibrio alginolyticus]
MAFLLCVGFSDLGGMRQHWYCVAHPLTERYVNGEKSQNLNSNFLLKLIFTAAPIR